MIVHVFTIPLSGVTLLTTNKRRTLHHYAEASLTKAQRTLSRNIARRGPYIIPGPTDTRHVFFTLIRAKGQRFLDTDTLGAVCKPFLDGIVDAGLLVNDSPAFCTPHYEQRRNSFPELRVWIEE